MKEPFLIPRLAVRGISLGVAFLLGAATFFGSKTSEYMHDHWPLFALGAALAMAIFIIVQLELKRVNGIEGIARAEPQRDQFALPTILAAMRNAKKIDMLGFNLRHSWMKPYSKFEEMMTARFKAENDIVVRIVIADPDRPSLSDREKSESGMDRGRMRADGDAVKNFLADLRSHAGQNKVEVKLVDASLIYCSIIAADDRMFATWYLSFRTGSLSPTFEFAGEKSPFLATFRQEFDELWRRGVSMDA